MRLRGVFAVFLLIVLVSVVSAQACSIVTTGTCTGNEIIGVSAMGNAHAQIEQLLKGAGPYPFTLCCPDIQLSECLVDADAPGEYLNNILRLSSETNAHVQSPNADVDPSGRYSINVCVDAICTSVSQSTCPDNLPDQVLSFAGISSQTNAHIGAFGSYDSLEFGFNICCEDLPTLGEGSAFWKNLERAIITQADTGDAVELSLFLNTLTGAETVSYEIYKETGVTDIIISTIPSQDRYDRITNPNDEAIARWIVPSNLQTGDKIYFVANIGTRGFTSNELTIRHNSTNPNANNPPRAIIVYPEEFDPEDPDAPRVFLVNIPIEFDQDSRDEDDPLKGLWEYDVTPGASEGTTVLTDSEIRNHVKKMYSFTGTGNKITQLRVTEDGPDANRRQTDTDRVAFVVVDPNRNETIVRANIFMPEEDSIVQTETGMVDVAANGSYVIQTGNGKVICLAGNCPSFYIGTGNQEIPIETNANTQPLHTQDLRFDWTFNNVSSADDSGTGENPSHIQFEEFFDSNTNGTRHLINLSVTYLKNNNNISNTVFRAFTVECIDDDGECEPIIPPEEIPTSCEDFDADEDTCDNSGVVTYEVVDACLLRKTIECFWDEDANNGQGECLDDITSYEPVAGYSCEDTEGVCQYVQTDTRATTCGFDGFLTYTISTIWTGLSAENRPASCVDSTRQVPCFAEAALPFFGFWQFAGAIGIMILVYSAILLRKRE